MKKLITFLTCLSCAYMILHPLRLVFDGGQALSMLLPTVLIIITDTLFGNRSFITAVIYTAIVLLLRSIGVEYFEAYLSQLVAMFFSICCMEHYLKTRDAFFAKSVLIVYYLSFAIMCAISIPQFYLFPEMTRQLVLAEQEGMRVASQFYWSIAYSSMHEIPLLLIPLVALYKKTSSSLVRIGTLITLLLLFVALMLGDATTPLLLSVAILFVLFLYKPRRPLSYNMKRLVIISGFLIVVLNKFVLVALLSTVQPIFEGTTNYTKIEDTKYQLLTGDVEEQTNLGQREIVYNMSEKTFLSHPFSIEMSNDNIGKHSFIRDHLAVLGLILIIPLIILTYLRYKDIAKYFNRYKYFFIVNYLALIMMAYFKNFFLKIDAWFIVPVFLLILEQQYNQNERKYILSKGA